MAPLQDAIRQQSSRWRNIFLISLVVPLLIVITQFQTISQGFRGPRQVSVSELANFSEGEYVTTSGSQMINLWNTISVSRRSGARSVTSSTYALLDQASGRVALVSGGREDSPRGVTGVIAPLSSSDRDELGRLLQDSPQRQQIMNALSTNKVYVSNQTQWALGLSAVAGIWTLFVLFQLFRNQTLVANPNSHPLFNKMRVAGVHAPLTSELLDANRHVRTATSLITPTVLVNLKDIAFTPTKELIWAYHNVTPKRGAWKNYLEQNLIVGDRKGVKSVFVHRAEADVQRALEFMAQHLPWLVLGYSEDIEKSYNTNRESMIAWVDQRRGQPA